MNEEVTIRITKVLLKYNLSITSLSSRHNRSYAYVSSRREVAYVLAKEFNYHRRDIASVLNCRLPMVSYLIHHYCKEHNLEVPKYISREHPVDTILKYILGNPKVEPKVLRKALFNLYWIGYGSGHQKAKKKRFDVLSFPGVPRVPSTENNSPVSLLGAPTGLLNEVLDDQETAERVPKGRNKAR